MYAQEQDRPLNFTSVQAPINPVFYSYYIATPESGIKKRKKKERVAAQFWAGKCYQHGLNG
jgi:hypothetical protein